MPRLASFSIPARIVVAGLLLGAIGDRSEAYYEALLWITCAVGAHTFVIAADDDRTLWSVALAFVTVAFNPICPARLPRELWVHTDVAAAVLFSISTFVIRPVPSDPRSVPTGRWTVR